LNIFELSPATRLRIRQELANSKLTEPELIEVLVIEALNARYGDVRAVARIMGCSR
jgi:hypothetical protein